LSSGRSHLFHFQAPQLARARGDKPLCWPPGSVRGLFFKL
jgi:hypothetical protein